MALVGEASGQRHVGERRVTCDQSMTCGLDPALAHVLAHCAGVVLAESAREVHSMNAGLLREDGERRRVNELVMEVRPRSFEPRRRLATYPGTRQPRELTQESERDAVDHQGRQFIASPQLGS